MSYSVVLQHTEEDCGAACLATVAKHFGHDYSLSQSREAVGTTAFGTTLLGLRRGAETLGFIARPVRASAELSRVEAALNPSEAEIEIATENIVQQRARGEATRAMLLRERQQLLQRITENQTTFENYEEDFGQIASDISSAVIRAPVSGVIQELTLRNRGQVVQEGELVARIALANNTLEVKAFVAIQDIGDVAVGQPVFMRVSACPYPDYGTLQATVTAISPDAITSQNSSRLVERGARLGSTTGYEVTARPETLVLEDAGRSCEIQAGMEGRVEIVSREETVLHYLLRIARLITDV